MCVPISAYVSHLTESKEEISVDTKYNCSLFCIYSIPISSKITTKKCQHGIQSFFFVLKLSTNKQEFHIYTFVCFLSILRLFKQSYLFLKQKIKQSNKSISVDVEVNFKTYVYMKWSFVSSFYLFFI